MKDQTVKEEQIVLHFVSGLRIKEIAKLIGVSKESVEIAIRRCIRKATSFTF